MSKFFLNIQHFEFPYTFELGNLENDEKYSDIPFMRNISNKMMKDYFKCFCPDVDVDDKANAALARGTKSEVFAKTKNLWDVFVDKYGDQVGL